MASWKRRLRPWVSPSFPHSGVPAVTAQGVTDVRFEGFRIAGDAQTPLQVGLRLADSEVEVEGVEISGAASVVAGDVAPCNLSKSGQHVVEMSRIDGGGCSHPGELEHHLGDVVLGLGRQPANGIDGLLQQVSHGAVHPSTNGNGPGSSPRPRYSLEYRRPRQGRGG